MYGSKEGHTVFRNDLVTLQFKTTLTDPHKDNWVAKNEDGDWCFYMNSLHKVNPSGKNHRLQWLDEIKIINVSQTNPLLADLLDKFEPVCLEIHGWNTEQSETRRKALPHRLATRSISFRDSTDLISHFPFQCNFHWPRLDYRSHFSFHDH